MQGQVVLPSESSPGIASVPAVGYGPRRAPTGAGAVADAVPAPVLAEGSSRVVTLAPELSPELDRGGLSARTMARMLVALVVLNVVDAIMTLWAIRLGVATEANPVMAAALSIGEPVFLASKLAVVSAGAAILWAARDLRIAQIGAGVCVAAYVTIAVVHLWTGVLIADALRALSGVG